MPPLPPPVPPHPPAPQSPPPKIAFSQRERDTEQDWDGECEQVEYAKCREIVKQYAGVHGTADVLAVSFSPCQGLPDETDCFLGCSYGGPNGGRYRFLLPEFQETYGAFNPKRCKYAGTCSARATTRPPRRLGRPRRRRRWSSPRSHDAAAALGTTPGGAQLAHTIERAEREKRLVNARTIDLALRDSHRTVQCFHSDDGEATCARYCWPSTCRAARVHRDRGADERVAAAVASQAAAGVALPPAFHSTNAPTCLGLREGETRCRDGGKVNRRFFIRTHYTCSRRHPACAGRVLSDALHTHPVLRVRFARTRASSTTTTRARTPTTASARTVTSALRSSPTARAVSLISVVLGPISRTEAHARIRSSATTPSLA